jgi:HK97 family phage major capsid protein
MDLKKLIEKRKLKLQLAIDEMEEFVNGLPEDVTQRTDEQAEEMERRNSEMEALEREIEKYEKQLRALDAQEKRYAAWDRAPEERNAAPNVATPIEVFDKPVYNGRFALGMQLRDIALAKTYGSHGPAKDAAVRRLEKAENRRIYIANRNSANVDAEYRAAGTPTYQENVATDGGIFLETETSMELIDKGFNNSEVLKRADRRTMTGPKDKLDIITRAESSRKDGYRHGGIRWYTASELDDDFTATKTKWEKLSVEPRKIYSFYYASNEILADIGMLTGEVNSLVMDEFNFAVQTWAVDGVGAPDPMIGLLKAPCMISVAKDTGQTADTITGGNIMNMRKRLWSGGWKNAVWFYNQFAEDQLISLYIPIGDAGELMRLYNPIGRPGEPYGRLWGRPCIPIEQCEELGDVGDIMLVDMSQYIVVDKGAMESASSIHVKFLNDQTAFRFTYRIEGQPKWKKALTPYKGSTTTSPIVTIAARA